MVEVEAVVDEVVFKNPQKLAISQLHLEIKRPVKNKKVFHKNPISDKQRQKEDNLPNMYQTKNDVIPALDYEWVSHIKSYCEYQEYYPQFPIEENNLFIEKNLLFNNTLVELLNSSYHIFWCTILFEQRVKSILQHFVAHPVYWYDFGSFAGLHLEMYNEISANVLKVYKRMLQFKESETEHMSEEVGMDQLCTKSVITLPVIIQLAMLYRTTDEDFIKKLIKLYCTEKRKEQWIKELRLFLHDSQLGLQVVGGYICGFEEDAAAVGIDVRPKPPIFDPYWIAEVVAYALNIFSGINSFLPFNDEALEIAIEMGLPEGITDFYNVAFSNLYDTLEDRSQIPKNLEDHIYKYLSISRTQAIGAFNVFVSNSIQGIVREQGNDEEQEKFTEMYLNLIMNTMEDGVFFYDYNVDNPISFQIEMIRSFCPNIDPARTDFIQNCIHKLPVFDNESFTIFECKPGTSTGVNEPKPEISMLYDGPVAGTSQSGLAVTTSLPTQDTVADNKPSLEEINKLLQTILDTLPHLGDGFVLQCLEHYKYNATDVLSAILDENLPPDLAEIPFDTIRIPDEPEPEKPILAYRGKRNDYRDTMELLNDKSNIGDIKNFVLQNSTVTYDIYDDEYDDRDDDQEDIRNPEQNYEDRVYSHMQNRLENVELVSDPSDSSSDEEPAQDNRDSGGRRPFCEDPAVIRARREAQKGRGRGGGRGGGRERDVVGKPKGQGQEKSVLQNRDKKNVQKSSKANHNRKGGSQWKRSRGMMPS